MIESLRLGLGLELSGFGLGLGLGDISPGLNLHVVSAISLSSISGGNLEIKEECSTEGGGSDGGSEKGFSKGAEGTSTGVGGTLMGVVGEVTVDCLRKVVGS